MTEKNLHFHRFSVSAGEDIIIYRDSSAYASYFASCFSEFEVLIAGNNNIDQNGDDAIELFENGQLIETFWGCKCRWYKPILGIFRFMGI